MQDKTYNVLFICAGNSARSVIAEGLMNELGQGRFKAFSAGSHPKGAVHPLALKALATNRIPTDGFRSKSWEEFARPGAPEVHFGALPLETIDRHALQTALVEIGNS